MVISRVRLMAAPPSPSKPAQRDKAGADEKHRGRVLGGDRCLRDVSHNDVTRDKTERRNTKAIEFGTGRYTTLWERASK